MQCPFLLRHSSGLMSCVSPVAAALRFFRFLRWASGLLLLVSVVIWLSQDITASGKPRLTLLWIGGLQVTLYLTAGGFFVFALYRLLTAVRQEKPSHSLASPAWALFAFSSPLLNLIVPFFIVRDTWRVCTNNSSPSDAAPVTSPGLSNTASEQSLLIWWSGHLSYCGAIAAALVIAPTQPQLLGVALVLTSALIILVASAGMGILNDFLRLRK